MAADAPPFMSRRRWLQGALALTAASLAGSLTLKALADDTSAAPIDAFMSLSQALTARSTLDHDVGARLLAALQKSSPDLLAQLPALAGALAAGSADANQQALALKILEAWYLGTVDNAVVIYEQALMYDVVSDTLIVRSYCPNKPGFWAAKPIERQA
nr:Fructose dehydrogenase small subunit [Paraburkholderia busanensis]